MQNGSAEHRTVPNRERQSADNRKRVEKQNMQSTDRKSKSGFHNRNMLL